MKKNYKDEFEPHLTYSTKENKYVCSSNFIAVGRECYKYPGLKDKKNDILVYSAILAGLNNTLSETFSYSNTDISNRLALDTGTVRRSIRNIEGSNLISVSHPSNNKRNIRALKDLRYPTKETGKRKPKKDFIKVYDRIFYYPLITKPMVHVYSYLLSLKGVSKFKDCISVSYEKMGNALGYSKNQIIKIIKGMEAIGLIKVIRNGNKKYVILKVDFSQKQPEEIDYEDRYNKIIEQRKIESRQQKSPIEEIEYKISALESQQEKLKKKLDKNQYTEDEFMRYRINQGKLKELSEQLKEIQYSIECYDCNVTTASVDNENTQLLELVPDSNQSKPATTKWSKQSLFEDEDDDW